MESKNFAIGDLLGYGWKVTTSNLGFFIGLGFIFFPLSYLSTVFYIILGKSDISGPMYGMVYGLITVLSFLLGSVLGIGVIKIVLSFIDGTKPSIGKLFDVSGCFWRYLGTVILYTLVMWGGLLLFIVPGIIWAIQFGLATYYAVDKGLGPVEALKASSRATKGVRLDLLGLGILAMLMFYAGFLCFFVGAFVTYPLMMIVFALVYRQLLAQTPELAEFGIGPVPVAEHIVEEQVLEDTPVNENMQ